MACDASNASPPPPDGLKAAGLRVWAAIHSEYEFPGSPEATLLVEELARTADMVDRLQRIVDEAPTLRTRGSRSQDVAIPELEALRAYRGQYAALIRQLDLPAPIDDDDLDPRPDVPMSRTQAARVAAQARWSKP
ncbi:hypothetical protein [Mycolicibacterium smegmatis]|uniref:Uncharacterized protein n=1 Tax=Mycolicibacterium smegmatis (strain MKD8) TaxID=1214915 RepID=A0A2U9PQ23_MYCSE|nr:hypothetical protein [Mycolicibacterium smegmatis]AWT53859.1 hypothetical protein D806_028850 [Mycolicibacterium smegmatis MKD8]